VFVGAHRGSFIGRRRKENEVTTILEPHPLAELIPEMSDEEYAALRDDIEARGLVEPILLLDDKILDGRHRYRACAELGIEPKFARYVDGDPIGRVISANLRRRHLSTGQLAALAASLEPAIAAEARKHRDEHAALLRSMGAHVDADSVEANTDSVEADPPQRAPQSRERAAALVGTSGRAVSTYKRIEREAPELARQVRAGDMALDAAERAVKAHVAHNSGNNGWYTPEPFIISSRAVLGGEIDLDPASCEAANEIVKAKRIYSVEQDGLSLPWKGRIWMNPPYSQPLISQFCEKLIESFTAGDVEAAVALVNNATETAWFQGISAVASAVCFPRGRVRFWHPDKPASAPLQGQAVLYLGPTPGRFVEEFSPFGRCWT